MSTSGSLLPVVLRGARPGELPAVRWPRPVVPSAQLVDHRAVTTTRSTRLLQPWQRHSEPGPAARAEAVVAPPWTNRPGCARSRQGTEFAVSRLRASRVTFVRRQRPYRRSPRSRSRGCCSARAKRSSRPCRHTRCSLSSEPAARWVSRRVLAMPGNASARSNRRLAPPSRCGGYAFTAALATNGHAPRDRRQVDDGFHTFGPGCRWTRRMGSAKSA